MVQTLIAWNWTLVIESSPDLVIHPQVLNRLEEFLRILVSRRGQTGLRTALQKRCPEISRRNSSSRTHLVWFRIRNELPHRFSIILVTGQISQWLRSDDKFSAFIGLTERQVNVLVALVSRLCNGFLQRRLVLACKLKFFRSASREHRRHVVISRRINFLNWRQKRVFGQVNRIHRRLAGHYAFNSGAEVYERFYVGASVLLAEARRTSALVNKTVSNNNSLGLLAVRGESRGKDRLLGVVLAEIDFASVEIVVKQGHPLLGLADSRLNVFGEFRKVVKNLLVFVYFYSDLSFILLGLELILRCHLLQSLVGTISNLSHY